MIFSQDLNIHFRQKNMKCLTGKVNQRNNMFNNIILMTNFFEGQHRPSVWLLLTGKENKSECYQSYE